MAKSLFSLASGSLAPLVACLADDGRDVHHPALNLLKRDALAEERMGKHQGAAASQDEDERELRGGVPALSFFDGKLKQSCEAESDDFGVDEGGDGPWATCENGVETGAGLELLEEKLDVPAQPVSLDDVPNKKRTKRPG